jgi:hypothetical protein
MKKSEDVKNEGMRGGLRGEMRKLILRCERFGSKLMAKGLNTLLQHG